MNILSTVTSAVSNAASTAHDKALELGDTRSGKTFKLAAPLLAVVLACIPIIGSHIESRDRIKEQQELWKLQHQVESNRVATVETAAKVESNSTELTKQAAAIKYVAGPEVIETAKTVEWANAPAPTK